MNKYTVNFIGITKTCYADNLEQAFQESAIWADAKGLSRDFTINEDSEYVENPPYFGIYQKLDKMTNNDLKKKFKITGKNARDFMRWAESKGFKVHDATVSRHLAGTQSITEPWGISYTCFFESCLNASF